MWEKKNRLYLKTARDEFHGIKRQYRRVPGIVAIYKLVLVTHNIIAVRNTYNWITEIKDWIAMR